MPRHAPSAASGSPASWLDRTAAARDAVDLIRYLFLDVPGARLSARAASRLSGLALIRCQRILEALESTRFLTRSGRNGFTRRMADPTR